MAKKAYYLALPIILVASLLMLICYKSLVVPATYDEVTTWYEYTGVYHLKACLLNYGGNSNNHVLNSLFITIFNAIFGNSEFAMRLPNMLSFLLLSGGLYFLAKRFFNSSPFLFCLPFVCLLLNPYLIDFYGLARGYGMANAFMSCSIVSLLLFTSSDDDKHYYYTVIFAALSAFANFTFLIFWVAVHLLLLANLLTRKGKIDRLKKLFPKTALVAAILIALSAIPVISMQQCIHFKLGNYRDFYNQTFLGLIDRFQYGHSVLHSSHFAYAIIASLIIAYCNGVRKMIKAPKSFFYDPANLTLILLVLVYVINLVQVHFSDTDYLIYRTALLYYVLYIFVLVFLLRDIAAYSIASIQVATSLLTLYLVSHFMLSVSLKSVYEWSYDAYTHDVMAYITEYKNEHPEIKKVDLNLTNCFRNSFSFDTIIHRRPWFQVTPEKYSTILSNKTDTSCESLFYYTSAYDAKALKNYTVVKEFHADGLWVPLPDSTDEQVLLLRK